MEFRLLGGKEEIAFSYSIIERDQKARMLGQL